ncbi:MAG: hypothetical protein KC502_16725 [Myxococcales bacterium]|nr:hypothetical protein [Myxococcales bacterium]
MSIRHRWRTFRHQVAFPTQLAFGVFFLKLFGDEAACERQERLLAAAKVGTVGWALHRLLHKHEVRLVPGYQGHDLKHVLLQFDLTATDEMRMQAFMTGNAGLSTETFIGLLFLLWTPEMWNELPRWVLAGRLAPPIGHLDFEQTLERDVVQLRQHIGMNAALSKADAMLRALRHRRPGRPRGGDVVAQTMQVA